MRLSQRLFPLRQPVEQLVGFTLGIPDDLESARFVERRGLLARVVDRRGRAAQLHARLKPVPHVRTLTDRNQEPTNLPAAGPADAKHVPEGAVGPLVERPREPDAGLDGRDAAGPLHLVG